MEHTYILKDENTATLTVLFWTELVVADLVAVGIKKKIRLSFTHDFKFHAVKWHFSGEKIYYKQQTSLKFTKTSKEWDCWGRKHYITK